MVNAEVLPLIIFSLVFGGVLTTLGERGQIIIRFFEGVNEAIMGMVHILRGWPPPCAFIAHDRKRTAPSGWQDIGCHSI
ncbi:MAG: dicarboxylate/amino acid:cation symporter [Nitrospirota bacterium]|nr:dicarboxylate/amino acid:cation symporter [Nitrospirota bacterium]MDH5700883.1 dicarboxylate/amino acid:cation symporter [Nitrospirota bacterium]